MTIINFPHYNLYNIPEALRKLAREIESGEIDTVHIVIAMHLSSGDGSYRAFGKDFTKAHAVGLLEYANFKS